MDRTLYEPDHREYRELVREFVAREVVPHQERWDNDRLTGRDVWLAAGKQGVIGLGVPEVYGGAGQPDFRYRMVVCEELAAVGNASLTSSFGLQDDIAIPYIREFGTEAQQMRWLPRQRLQPHRGRTRYAGVERGRKLGKVGLWAQETVDATLSPPRAGPYRILWYGLHAMRVRPPHDEPRWSAPARHPIR